MIDRGKGEAIMGCEACKIRRYAERKPESWIARLWRWHTGWCPGVGGGEKLVHFGGLDGSTSQVEFCAGLLKRG